MTEQHHDDEGTRSLPDRPSAAGGDQSRDETRTSADKTADMERLRRGMRPGHQAPLAPGTDVSHYEIEDRIGAGGMGEVYLAQDTQLNRKVALKFLAPHLASDGNFRRRFMEEAQAAAQLNHPNIVTIYEVGEFENQPFLAMEYVTGKSLKALVSEGNSSLDEVVGLAIQICEGVQEAHEAGIVHRDLKPDNIKMMESGRIKVLDFGLAKRLGVDSVDEKGRIEGTLYYMSPEQVSGSELSIATDVFSFGVLMYEFLTGKRPFEGETTANVMYMILHEDPIPPRDIRADLPDWADMMILKLLSKNPADRFGDMREVRDFLEVTRKGGDDAVKIGSYKTRRKTVTVIELRNLSGDQSWNYFCEGFTDDLIREISRRTDLVVSAEPSTSKKCDIREIFTRCRSDYAITGTLMKWQGAIRLSLSGYADHGDELFFGEEYEGESGDLFRLLSDAARGASSALASISGSPSIAVAEAAPADVSAYDFYLKGRSYYQTNKPEDLEFAAQMFAKALELDPGLAVACTGLSDVYTFQYMAYYDRTPKRIELARQEAQRALSIDPRLPEAHRSLGRYYMNIGDLDSAERSFLRTVEISPKYAIGYRTLGWLYEVKGDHQRALGFAKEALELAPTDMETLLLMGLIYIHEDKQTLAIATLQRAIELGPDYGRAYYNLGSAYLKLGALDAALENFLLAAKYRGDPNSYIDAGYVHMINGNYESAEDLLKMSIKEEWLSFIALYTLGLMERLRGNTERAQQYFAEAVDDAAGVEQQDPRNPLVLSYKAMALASINRTKEARALLERLPVLAEGQGHNLLNVARGYALIGDRAKANQFKSMALSEHAGPTKRELEIDPHFSLT